MTTKAIKARLAAIKTLSRDAEAAHSLEDRFWGDFIEYVATLPDKELAAKAKLVLSTRDIEFPRWYS